MSLKLSVGNCGVGLNIWLCSAREWLRVWTFPVFGGEYGNDKVGKNYNLGIRRLAIGLEVWS